MQAGLCGPWLPAEGFSIYSIGNGKPKKICTIGVPKWLQFSILNGTQEIWMFLTDWKRDWGKECIDNWAPCWPKTFPTRCTVGLQSLLAAEARCTSVDAVGSCFHSPVSWPQKLLEQGRYWRELETNSGQTQLSVWKGIRSLRWKVPVTE